MPIKQFQGGTAPMVDDLGTGGHVPLTRLYTEGQLIPVDGLAQLGRFTPEPIAAAPGQLILNPTTLRVHIEATAAMLVRVNGSGTLAMPAMEASLQGVAYIGANGVLDFDVPAGSTLHFVRAGTTDGVAYITELV
jgi:hypothetical protein